MAISMANRGEAYRDMAQRMGRRMSTGGAAQAPRCLYRKPTLVASAHSTARNMPTRIVMKDLDQRATVWNAASRYLSAAKANGLNPCGSSTAHLRGGYAIRQIGLVPLWCAWVEARYA